MAELAIDNCADTPDELLEQAQKAVERTQRVAAKELPQIPALLLAAVNKKLVDIAPGEEPYATAKRLAAEWDSWVIERGYDSLLWYYEQSLKSVKFGDVFDLIDYGEAVGFAEDLLRKLNNGNA